MTASGKIVQLRDDGVWSVAGEGVELGERGWASGGPTPVWAAAWLRQGAATQGW